MPVRVRKIPGIPGCEQRQVPDFLTLLGVTQAGLWELQERTEAARKIQVAQVHRLRKARPVSLNGPSLKKN